MSKDLVETGKETLPSTNLFGAEEGENFLLKTLGQNFKQVKETQIKYKSEDIERELKRRIQDAIIDLKRKSRQPQDELIKIIPTSALSTFSLADIDEKEFCNNLQSWAISCHNDAQKILVNIRIYQSLFGKAWEYDDDKTFLKSMLIDFNNI